MFTLYMNYCDASLREGYGSETVQAQNIPQIGQTIDSDKFYRGTQVVTEVYQDVRNGVLSAEAHITLRQKD